MFFHRRSDKEKDVEDFITDTGCDENKAVEWLETVLFKECYLLLTFETFKEKELNLKSPDKKAWADNLDKWTHSPNGTFIRYQIFCGKRIICSNCCKFSGRKCPSFTSIVTIDVIHFQHSNHIGNTSLATELTSCSPSNDFFPLI